MNKVFILLLFIFSNCKIDPPCSVLDSTCNVLGYFIPNLIRPNQTTGTGVGTGTGTGAASPTFNISTNGGPKTITISWAAQTGATSYRIYRKTSAGVTSSDTEITSGGTTALNFIESNVPSGETRFYRVSYISAGREILSNENSSQAINSGLALFLRSDIINQANASAVSTWSDDSGNNYNLSMVTPCVTAPTFLTNVQNGKPIVQFLNVPPGGPNNICLTRADGNPLMNNGLSNYASSLILALRINSTSNQAFFNIGDSTYSNKHFLASNAISHGGNNRYLSGMSANFNSFNQFVILSWTINLRVSTNYSATYFLNGKIIAAGITTATTNPSSDYFTTANQITLAANNNVAADGTRGDFLEVIYYNRAITDNETRQINCYLSSKYAIALDSSVSCN